MRNGRKKMHWRKSNCNLEILRLYCRIFYHLFRKMERLWGWPGLPIIAIDEWKIEGH